MMAEPASVFEFWKSPLKARVMGRALVLAGVLMALGPSAPAIAQVSASDYPSRPLRFIVPTSAGGLADTMGRMAAQHLSARLGQPVVIDNRPGANEAIGGALAAQSPPDGYTVLITTEMAVVYSAAISKKPQYDPIRDLAPIAPLLTTPLYLAVHPSLPARSVQELVALARARPGKLTFAGLGTGSAQHLAGELFKQQAKIDIVHVPYKGTAPATADLIAGQIDMFFQGGASTLPHVRSGKLRVLASTGSARGEVMPELQTMIEAGLPEFEVSVWFGFFAPAGTARPILERLNREVSELLRAPATRERFAVFGAELIPGSPEDLGARVRKSVPYWSKVVRAAGITSE